MILDTIKRILQYSDSAHDFEIVLWVLTFQDTKELLNLMQYPDTDFLDSMQHAQSESQYVIKCMSLSIGTINPKPSWFLVCFTILMAFMCETFGAWSNRLRCCTLNDMSCLVART